MTSQNPLRVESLESRLVPSVSVPCADLCGYVYVDANKDGIRQSTEKGIEGVRIDLIRVDTGVKVASTTTDKDGAYQFKCVSPTTYQIVEPKQPNGFNDGRESSGTTPFPGTIGTDVIQVEVPINVTKVCDQNFGETKCPPPPDTTGKEGLTPGYWKNNAVKHGAVAWTAAGSFQYQTLGSVFNLAGTAYDSLKNVTLVKALDLNGGGVNALMRHAVAAVLNAAHPEVDYPLTVAEIKSLVNAALASGSATQIEALKNTLDSYNNLGANLDQHGRAV